jgi:hypothetical protein
VTHPMSEHAVPASARRTRSGVWRQRGVSLLEVTAILLSLVALSVALIYKTTDFFAKAEVLDSEALLKIADHQLRQYIAANGRLPCPDLNGDGLSDGDADGSCNGQQKGYLPYKTLGMAEANYVYGEVPMLYGAYQDGTISFTSRAQTFVPDYADKTNAAANTRLATDPRNIFDFCASLGTLNALAGPSATGVSVNQGATTYNAVFALALPGQANRDGLTAGWAGGPSVNAQYDGLNATSDHLFEFPKAPVTPLYDDRTAFRTGTDLYDYFRCAAMNESISLLSQAITVQKETEDFADANRENAVKGVIVNAIGIALATWELGTTIATIAEGIEQITLASSLLATAVATCIVLVGCAFIPVYTTSLSLAIAGTALATAASIAAAVDLGLNITATVLYADLVSRTANATSPPQLPLTGFPPNQLPPLYDKYVASEADAKAAYDLTLVPPIPGNTVANYDTIQQGTAATVAGGSYIGSITDAQLKDLLQSALSGNTQTCVDTPANCLAAGFTAQQNPSTSGTGANTTITYTTSYVKDVLATSYPAYAPGVVPSVGQYYDAVLQQNITAPPPITDLNSCNAMGFPTAPCQPAPIPAPPSPTTAMNTSNTVVGNYTTLLQAVADFDVKNLDYEAKLAAYNTALAAYNAAACPGGGGCTATLINNLNAATTNRDNAAAARTAALTTLRTAIGDPSWNHTGNTSLCGGGANVSGCGWMNNTAPSAGNSTTPGKTSSSVINGYLTDFNNYEDARVYQQKLDTAAAKASAAWSNRNTYKTALCSVGPPSVDWVGASSIPSADPAQWDVSEQLLVPLTTTNPPTGLNCSGGGTPTDLSAEEAAARAAEQARYCLVGGPDYDANLCALYSSTGVAATIQGAEPIVRELIRRGITK